MRIQPLSLLVRERFEMPRASALFPRSRRLARAPLEPFACFAFSAVAAAAAGDLL